VTGGRIPRRRRPAIAPSRDSVRIVLGVWIVGEAQVRAISAARYPTQVSAESHHPQTAYPSSPTGLCGKTLGCEEDDPLACFPFFCSEFHPLWAHAKRRCSLFSLVRSMSAAPSPPKEGPFHPAPANPAPSPILLCAPSDRPTTSQQSGPPITDHRPEKSDASLNPNLTHRKFQPSFPPEVRYQKRDPPEHLHCSHDPTRPHPFHPPQADPLLCPISPSKPLHPTGSHAAAKQQPKPTSPWARHFLSPSLKRYVRISRRRRRSALLNAPPSPTERKPLPSSLDGCLFSRGTRCPTSTPILDLASLTRPPPRPVRGHQRPPSLLHAFPRTSYAPHEHKLTQPTTPTVVGQRRG
jgi:hypothetical protein